MLGCYRKIITQRRGEEKKMKIRIRKHNELPINTVPLVRGFLTTLLLFFERILQNVTNVVITKVVSK
jgi:hypothetical protein